MQRQKSCVQNKGNSQRVLNIKHIISKPFSHALCLGNTGRYCGKHNIHQINKHAEYDTDVGLFNPPPDATNSFLNLSSDVRYHVFMTAIRM